MILFISRYQLSEVGNENQEKELSEALSNANTLVLEKEREAQAEQEARKLLQQDVLRTQDQLLTANTLLIEKEERAKKDRVERKLLKKKRKQAKEQAISASHQSHRYADNKSYEHGIIIHTKSNDDWYK